jgi:beta-phosphoglucomutase-like phosphatase (HAD superfamily)
VTGNAVKHWGIPKLQREAPGIAFRHGNVAFRLGLEGKRLAKLVPAFEYGSNAIPFGRKFLRDGVPDSLFHPRRDFVTVLDGTDRKLRKSIKDPFLVEYSRPILSTVKFLEALAAAGSHLCLVTQTTWEDAEKPGKALGVPMNIFAAHECCGDDAYKLIPPATEKKMLAYARGTASAGGQLSNALAIEDSESGLAAAIAAGVQCLGLKAPQNSQDLSRAALVVSDLGKFASAEIADCLANCPDATAAVAYLRGKARQRFHVGCSVGGNNYQVAQVLRSGDLCGCEEAAWSQDESCQTAQGLANRLATLVRKIAGDNYVDLVGLSIKLFEEALREHGVQFGSVVAMLDNEAALRGEMHPRGGLAGVTAGMIKIWGTGRGCLAFEKGEVLREVRANEPGSDRWRVYSSDGRHLIWTQGRDGFFWYEYRGVPPGETRAPIDKERITVLQAMEAEHLDLSEYVGSAQRNLGAGTALWAGLTVAALKGNQ